MKKLILTVCLAMMCGLIAPGMARADYMYAVTLYDQLISIDTATGAGTLIGYFAADTRAFGLSDRGTSVYTFDPQAGVIVELDLTTGGILSTTNIGVVTAGEGGIAFRSDGIGFLSRSSGPTGRLWSFDITVPSSTAITEEGGLIPSMDGLDFDGSDVLYGLKQARESNYELYTINQITGATTLVGDTGFSRIDWYLGGLTFTSDGILYGVMNDSFYTLNPLTGAATLVGATGFSQVSGLTSVVPLPGAVLLGILGLSVAGLKLRKFA